MVIFTLLSNQGMNALEKSLVHRWICWLLKKYFALTANPDSISSFAYKPHGKLKYIAYWIKAISKISFSYCIDFSIISCNSLMISHKNFQYWGKGCEWFTNDNCLETHCDFKANLLSFFCDAQLFKNMVHFIILVFIWCS